MDTVGIVSHMIRIVAEGTVGRPTVPFDGFVILR